MALQIYHKRAENTHENEQFRRIARDLKLLFEKMKWDGLLIGNPDNSNFSRFKADAILYYTNGLIIIDLKDYAGDIKLPPNSSEFKTTKWYIDTDIDNRRIEIKGGSRFINPFKQLESYRNSFIELIKSNLILSERINYSRISIVNVFSGPIKLNINTPRDIPYYRIVQESDFHSYLYDFASPVTFQAEIANELNRIFPSETWVGDIHFKSSQEQVHHNYELIDDNFKNVVAEFLQQPEKQILLIESGDAHKRDEWMHYLLTNAINFDIPQTEIWTHSTRIARRIRLRAGIEPHSLFTTIYGGTSDNYSEGGNQDDTVEANLISETELPEQVQDVIGIRSDKELDENSVIVLCEAHLVTRSLYQTELLRFGSGRLLEDMFTYLKLNETKRKLICIGDPYSLSYGDVDESAISTETISILHKGEILKFRDINDYSQDTAINKLKLQITSSIDKGFFNNLLYEWDNKTLFEVDKSQAESTFHKWFKYACEKEPDYSVLVFKNKDALKISQWIRKFVQNKKEDYAQGDLLMANNSFNIPDETGLSYPQRIQNGMYLRIEKVLDRHNETITPKNRQSIVLKFVKLNVTCLSNVPNFVADIWILENYMHNAYELTLEEQVAFRVFVSNRLNEYSKKNVFEKSLHYTNLINSQEYKDAVHEQNELQKQLDKGQRVKTKHDEIGVRMRKMERRARKIHRQYGMIHLLNSDPMVNVALVQFGYSMNVHKALGSSFKEIVFNSFQGENFGITNEGYFRWLYTGLSCGMDSIKVINPLSINPLMNCVFEDTDNIVVYGASSKNKSHIEFPPIEIPNEVMGRLPEQLPDNVRFGIYHIISKLQPLGYLFERAVFVNYAPKVFFTSPNGKELDEKDKLCLVVHYNSKGAVSTVRIEKEGKSDRKVIEKLLYQLNKSIDTPKDWRHDTYENWIQQCKQSGYELSILEEHNNQTVFQIMNDKKRARFRLWYLNEGFFSKMAMLDKTTPELGNEIKQLLIDGYKA